MTHKEAKELFRNDKDAYGKPRHIMKNIDKIYDDFETQEWLKNFNISDAILIDIYKHLSVIENYLRGEHNHETDEIQKKEDLELYKETIRLKEKLFNHNI